MICCPHISDVSEQGGKTSQWGARQAKEHWRVQHKPSWEQSAQSGELGVLESQAQLLEPTEMSCPDPRGSPPRFWAVGQVSPKPSLWQAAPQGQQGSRIRAAQRGLCLAPSQGCGTRAGTLPCLPCHRSAGADRSLARRLQLLEIRAVNKCARP